MSTYSDYIRRKSQDAIKFGYSEGTEIEISDGSEEFLRDYEIGGNSIQQNSNLMIYPYSVSFPRTSQDVTFNVNAENGSVTADGTNNGSANSYCIIVDTNSKLFIPKGRYYFSGCPAGGVYPNGYFIRLELYNGSTWVQGWNDVGDGTYINTINYTYDRIVFSIQVAKSVSVDNLVFKPYLTALSPDKDIIPYPYYYKELSRVHNGVTYSQNKFGLITVTGTPGNDEHSYYQIADHLKLNGKYWLYGCPGGGKDSSGNIKYGLYLSLNKDGVNSKTYYETDSGSIIDLTNEDYDDCSIGIQISQGSTMSSANFTPMLVPITYESQLPSFDNGIDIKSVGNKSSNLITDLYPFTFPSKTVQSLNELSYVESYGNVYIEGTATKQTDIILCSKDSPKLAAGKYWLCGAPSSADVSKYYLYVAFRDSSDGTYKTVREFVETGSGILMDLTDVEYDNIYISIEVKEGVTPHCIFSPSIVSIDDPKNNLLKLPYCDTSKTVYGITWTDNLDGTVSASGTSTSDDAYYWITTPSRMLCTPIQPGKYLIASGVTGDSNTTNLFHFAYGMNWSSSDTSDRKSIGVDGYRVVTIDKPMFYDAIINIKSGQTLDNLTFAPKLIKIDDMVGYKVPLVARSKNIIGPMRSVSKVYNNSATDQGVTFTTSSDYTTIAANGTPSGNIIAQCWVNIADRDPSSTEFEPYAVNKYSAIGCPKGGSESTYYQEIQLFSKYWTVIGVARDYGNGCTIWTTQQTKYMTIKLVVATGYTANNVAFKPMIVHGDIPTKYEPWKHTLVTNLWVDEPIRKIPSGQCDTIDFKNKAVTRQIGSKILNGTENWVQGTGSIENVAICAFNESYINGYNKCILQYGRFGGGLYNRSDYIGFTSWGGTPESTVDRHLMYKKPGTGPEAVKQLLADHPSEFIYKRASNTDEKFSVNNSLYNFKFPLLDGVTTVCEVDTEVKPSNVKVKYRRK